MGEQDLPEVIEGWSMWRPHCGLSLDIHSTRNACVAWWLWNMRMLDPLNDRHPWGDRKLSDREKKNWRKLRSEGWKPVRVYLSTQEPAQ